MNEFVHEFVNVEVMAKVTPFLLRGLLQTLLLCAVLIPIGLCSGLLTMLLTTSSRRTVRWPALAVVDVLRSFPPLVLLIFVYSGLPFIGLRVPPLVAVAVAFLLNSASYYSEIYRAGVASVPQSQWEAARSTGLSARQSFVYVVLPQAVRNVLPDLLSNTIELIKLTTLASVISVPELLQSANLARSLTYNSSPLILASAMYLVLLLPLVRLAARLEHRL